ncbi:MAG: PKD domain-containing protein [Bacteroidales bacterium]|nr:PKD domain-containing protein [Bacteroidales bacterium]
MNKIAYILISLSFLIFSENLSASINGPLFSSPPNCNAQFMDSADVNNPLLIHFYDLSSGNITSWDWDFGDGTTSNIQNPSHTYNSSGSYQVRLFIIDSINYCFDSIVLTIIVYANPNPCQANFIYNVNPTNNLIYSFTDQSLGNPYLWQWDFGDGTSSSLQNPNHTFAQAGNYTVSLIITTQSCVDTISQQVTVLPNSNTGSLLVYAFADSSYLVNGMLYLYQYDSISGNMLAYDSVLSTSNQGISYYNFPNIPMGYYYVYAKILSNSNFFASFYNTWMPNTIYSQFADSILVNSNNIYTNIQLSKSSVSYPAGSGSISGIISNKVMGTNLPLANVDVYLLLNDSNIITKTATNSQGEYEFSNLAFGTYYIHPEIIGKFTQNKMVSIGYENPDEDSASFVVDGKNIVAGISTKPRLLSKVTIFPNPVKNDLYIQSNTDHSIDLEIEIFDIQGRVIISKKNYICTHEQKRINVSNLTKGLYFIRLQSHDSQLIKKFIKN